MKLTRLDVIRLPGIDQAFQLAPGTGVNVLLGPNAVGKSSVARAVRTVLWPGTGDPGGQHLTADFTAGSATLRAVCRGAAPVWSRGGLPAEAPGLPGGHLAGCYRLTASDLLVDEAGDLDRRLARIIRTEMTGGFDLDALAESLAAGLPRRNSATVLSKERRAAHEAARGLRSEQEELARRQEGLAELDARIEAARGAQVRLAALESLRDLAAARREAAETAADLAAFPPAMARVHPDDPRAFAERRRALQQRRDRAAERQAIATETEGEIARLALPADGGGLDIARCEALVRGCREAERADVLARQQRAAAEAVWLETGGGALPAEGADAPPPPTDGPARPLALTALGGLLVVGALLPMGLSSPWPLVGGLAGCGLAVLGVWGLLRQVRGEARRRRADLVAARQRARVTGDELARELDAAGALLTGWGLPRPQSASEADASLAEVRARQTRGQDLAARLAAVRRERQEALRDAEDDARHLQEILRRLDLPASLVDPAPIHALAERLDPWREAEAAARTAARNQERLAGETAQKVRAAGLAEEPPAAELPGLIDEAQERMARLAELAEQRGALTNSIAAASTGTALADALAAETAAGARLEDWLERAAERHVEAALLDEIRDEHEALTSPPVLREAARLFDVFTEGRHELRLAAGPDGAVFSALDRESGSEQALAALSSGTRAQLLLAVRLAFIKGAEAALRPPVFLDESLTTSDPRRRAAVMAALGRFAAADDRQVFYLTSNPDDAGAWRGALAAAGLPEPTLIDLAARRGAGVAATAAELAPAPAPAAPAPEGRDPAAYGRALGVSRLDPRRGWEPVDVFHLAAPDLDLVHRLRVVGIHSAGVLAAAAPRLADAGLATAAERDRLAGALTVLRAFVDAWRTGRPRPATAADILASGAVTEKMQEKVLELLEQSDGNAAAFMTALRGGAVPRFRSAPMDTLQEHLTAVGCLDDRPPLGGEALLAAVQTRVAPGAQKTRTSAEEVRALVLRLEAAIPPGIAAEPSSRSSGSDPTG